jgi:uncharacterized protein YkwD
MASRALPTLLLLVACGGGGDDAVVATSPAASEPTEPAATCGLPRFREETLERVNAVRARGADCGTEGSFGAAPPLQWNDALTSAATAHSTDMAMRDYFSHTSPEGGTMADRVNAAGYRWNLLAENIAAGQRSIQGVIDGWIDSDGHCANVMNPSLREIGMACVSSDSASYPTYWTMNLGRPR